MKCAACRFAEGELVVRAPKALCRRCAAIVAHFLVSAPDVMLSALWNQTPDSKARVTDVIADADVLADLDLANAHAEMGLAQRAVELIFGQHARPDALEYALRAMRTAN